jgi:PadR family transcriptional regulator, regulatory protein PadR
VNKDKSTLLQGTLDMIVLKLLLAGPANGWDITQRIQVLSKDVLSVNYGSLYPALQRLETRGWVTSEWAPSENNRRAKFYSLTTAGRKQLDAEREAWERFSGALDQILHAG